MNKKIITIGLLFFILIMFDVSYADTNTTTGIDTPLSKLKPSYVLVSRLYEPSINKGDVIEFEVFLSGYGKIKNHKVMIYYPKNLLNESTPGEVLSNLVVHEEGCTYIDSPTVDRISKAINRFSFPTCIFIDVNPQNLPPPHTPAIAGETISQGSPPALFKLFTKKPKRGGVYPTGDMEITLVLTYTDGIEWYSSEHVIPIHINSYWEEHTTLNIIRIAILGAISIAIASLIWNYVTDKIKKD